MLLITLLIFSSCPANPIEDSFWEQRNVEEMKPCRSWLTRTSYTREGDAAVSSLVMTDSTAL